MAVLRDAGLKFRTEFGFPDIRTKADVAFERERVAVFVDGCFWHRCPTHSTVPKTNVDFWQDKLAQNELRDRRLRATLRRRGWSVLRVWEHERASSALKRICRVLSARRAIGGSNGK